MHLRMVKAINLLTKLQTGKALHHHIRWGVIYQHTPIIIIIFT